MAAKPPEYKLWVNDFDDAVKQVLDLLRESDGTAAGRTKAFFFRGWYELKQTVGLGASAVLRAIAQLLKSRRSDPDTREHFGKIIHVDCSLWRNRRAMQRAIAEELNLGHLIAEEFDKQDEDDDFRGIDVSSRAEIPSIGSAINESLRNERFLMIFHYGGDEDIDLVECGVPGVGTFGKGKVLWNNYGRFELSWREQKLMSSSADIVTYFSADQDKMTLSRISLRGLLHKTAHVSQQVRGLLYKEAAEVIGYTGMDDVNPSVAADCFLYSLFLTEQLLDISVDYGWDTHACNYWICDGILQGDTACEVGSALYGVIRMLRCPSDTENGVISNTRLAVHCLVDWLDRHRERYARWISISSNQRGAQDISTVPANASSYFLTYGGDGQLQLPNDLFQLASNLRVLKLCGCSFDFASPPFRCCHNLRFLWLDHCTNTGEEQGGGPCFPNLLVLDIRFTDFVLLAEMIELMTNLREVNTKGVSWRTVSHAWKKLQNLHKLRVTESLDVITVDTCSSVDMMNLELLDLSGNIHMESLPAMSSAGYLKMLVLDGCSSLEHVALEGAFPLLESFSFDGYGPAENWAHPILLPKKELRPKSRNALVQEAKVRKISLEGCARLHSMFLRALPNLEELDLSGTAIRTLDLGAMDVPWLNKLFLLGCEQLRSLLWDGSNPSLEVLHVDTRGKTRSVIYWGSSVFYRCTWKVLLARIAFTDGRFGWSAIEGLLRNYRYGSKVHLHISSTIHSQANITKSIEEIGPSQEGLVPTGPFLPYSDIVLAKDIVTRSSLVWDHRQLYPSDVHIEIGEGSHHLESMHDNQDFTNLVESLHVHDNILITTIPPRTPASWDRLEWCHVERCPNLHTLFTCRTGYLNFRSIRIFSASDLPMAYCIWGRGINEIHGTVLQHIYLHNCPRLVFVLPISFTLPNLETIQIAYCGNLQHIFPLDDKYPEEIASGVTFDNLKHIKLHHLHKLEQICEARLIAPALETISLRDCWRLRRLPAVARQAPKAVVDCEKDWWDKLEWDGLEASHDPSLFGTRHSAYYKRTIPRGSLLR